MYKSLLILCCAATLDMTKMLQTSKLFRQTPHFMTIITAPGQTSRFMMRSILGTS
jgi:hypothetical protein